MRERPGGGVPRCEYECPVCGGRCCAEPVDQTGGPCFLHEPEGTPAGREEAARRAGSGSLKEHLEARAARGESLHGVRLSFADLARARLTGADLRDAVLDNANLRGAALSHANLSEANLYNTNLREAGLRRANLRGACLDWAVLRAARGLQAQDCREINRTVPGFRSIKRMFQDADDRDGASEFAVREKREQRRLLWEERGRWFKSAHGLRTFGQWLVHCLLEVVCGYFERYLLPLLWAFVVIAVCGFAYAAGNGVERSAVKGGPVIGEDAITLGEGLYFSAVTFTTLGYGDFRPKPGGWRLVASAEAFVGAFLISVFVVTLAHRYVVR